MKLSELGLRLRQYLFAGTMRRDFLYSALAMLMVRLGGVSVAFVLSMVLARVLGASGFGLYSYVIAIAGVLSIPAALGLPQYLVREAAGRAEWVVHLRRWADRRVVIAGCLIAALMLLVAFFSSDLSRRGLFALAAIIPLFVALSEVRRGLLQGAGMVVRSQLASLFVSPFLILAGVSLVYLKIEQIEAWHVVVVTAIAGAAAFIFGDCLLRLVPKVDESLRLSSPPTVSTTDATRFMWLGALYLLLSRTDLIMLGLLSNDKEAGIYAVSSRAADLVPLVLVAANMVIAPRIARCYREGRLEEVQGVISLVMRLVFWVSLPIVTVLIVFADQLLSLFYGEVFSDGATVMRLLVFSQFILVLGGPLGTVLEMTGNEKASLSVLVWVVVLNVLLNIVAIPVFASTGAALSTCLCVIIGRVLLSYKVRKLVSLRPTIFGAW